MIVLPADAVQIGGYLMIRVKTKHMLYHLISQCIYLRYGRIMCGWQNANYFWDPTDLYVNAIIYYLYVDEESVEQSNCNS